MDSKSKKHQALKSKKPKFASMLRWILLLLCVSLAGQESETTNYSLLNIGYANHNGNYLELGYNAYLVRENDNFIALGAGVDLAYFERQFVAVPFAEIAYVFNPKQSKWNPYSEGIHSAFYLARLKVSPWHVQPEIGISILSLVELNAGWGFEFSEHSVADFDGLKLGINLRLPFQLFW